MSGGSGLNPPIQYSISWLLIGIFLMFVIIIWYAFVFWHTRLKQSKTIATLKKHAPVVVDISKLKQKYLALIREEANKYREKQISPRTLHINLSKLCRFFIFEVKGFPAPTLTLSDLKRSDQKMLTALIETYYPNEFDSILHGQPEVSVKQAEDLITQWQ